MLPGLSSRHKNERQTSLLPRDKDSASREKNKISLAYFLFQGVAYLRFFIKDSASREKNKISLAYFLLQGVAYLRFFIKVVQAERRTK
jgi:hypothetical protein